MTRWLRACLAALCLLWAGAGAAHEMSMAEIDVRQVGPTEFLWSWTAGNRSGEAVLQPQWPDGCADDNGVLRCGAAGLSGRLGMLGVGQRFSAVLVRVSWADGQTRVYTLTSAQPAVTLFGSADDRRGTGEIATAYGLLGVEHILGGIDHLLFVLGLLFLVGLRRRLVLTITAFTVAHSLTLALSALDLITLRPPPVEAVIALSIMLVAAEALHDKPTLSRRWPALVALLFGLMHGLGFAGALKEIGLPENHLAVALLTFNLGVEAGQLLVVAAAALLVLALRRWAAPDSVWIARARLAALYGIGAMAAFWTLERTAAIWA
jgi:hydrogenase/urease accessory protein HupE